MRNFPTIAGIGFTKSEVAVEQYLACVEAGVCEKPKTLDDMGMESVAFRLFPSSSVLVCRVASHTRPKNFPAHDAYLAPRARDSIRFQP